MPLGKTARHFFAGCHSERSVTKALMRLVLVSISLSLALVGCARTPSQPVDPWSSPAVSKTAPAISNKPSKSSGSIVTPSNDSTGRVISVNPRARYAVLGYSVGSVPAIDSHVYSYRGGLKVGELRVTGPVKENNTVADVVAGECQAGDEVRRD
jgi:hypothetical protein